jgi:mRNA interferase MazF
VNGSRIRVTSGDVVTVYVSGVVESKTRPVVVISTDEYHKVRPDLIYGVLTTKLEAATEVTDCVLQDWGDAGLHRECAFRSFIQTCPQSEVRQCVGRLSERDWKAVQQCMRTALNFE